MEFINLLILIFLGFSVTAQIDNGTNYIPDSRNSQLKSGSLCDQLFTKDGKTYNVLVKETTLEDVKYKMCRDYGSNASVSGPLISLENSKIEKIIFSDGNIKFFNKSNKVLKKNSVKSIDEPKSQLRKNMLSFSAGIGNYGDVSPDFSYSSSNPNYSVGNLRYTESNTRYYQFKYLRSLKSNSIVNFQVGLSLDFFDLPSSLIWSVYENGLFDQIDYGSLIPYNVATINFEMESTYSFKNKRLQYFAGLGSGLCLNSYDRFQFRFTNGFSLLSKNKVHCFSIKSSGLLTWFERYDREYSYPYNNSTGSSEDIYIYLDDYSNGYLLGIEVQYGFKF